MLLKTNCGGCIFLNRKEGKCTVNKPIFLEVGDNYNTLGYCSTKRGPIFLNLLQNKIKTLTKLDDINKEIDKENKDLGFLISCLDGNLDKIKLTINSLIDNINLISKIFVVSNNLNLEKQKQIIEYLITLKMPWFFENIQEDGVDDISAINYISRQVYTAWCLSVKAGDVIDKNTLENLYNELINKNNQVCFHSEDNDNVRICFSMDAFRQMEGHADMPFLEKVKHFDNWKEVCKKII